MRVLRRLQPLRPHLEPQHFRSIKFVPCWRCLGHGHFESDPPESMEVVSLSQVGALAYVAELDEANRLSCNQVAALQQQVLVSGLPETIEEDVNQLVDNCLAMEDAAIEFESRDGEEQPRYHLNGSDLAQLVHEYRLRTRPYFRSQ